MSDMPEWRKAWKLEDPEWVKARQKEWKHIKQSPIFEYYKKDQLEKVKNFFLTGSAFFPEPPEEEWNWLRYHPDKRPLPVSNSPLLECWLGVEQSESHWQAIKARCKEETYNSTRQFFRRCLQNDFPEQGYLFDGLEERLYYFFGPTRCLKEDYSTEKEYISSAQNSFGFTTALVQRFLTSESPNECDVAKLVALEYTDSIVPYYEYIVDKYEREKTIDFSRQSAAFLAIVFEMACGQRNATTSQQELAQKIAKGLAGKKFPVLVAENFSPYVNGV